jgi:hypothetical protein
VYDLGFARSKPSISGFGSLSRKPALGYVTMLCKYLG